MNRNANFVLPFIGAFLVLGSQAGWGAQPPNPTASDANGNTAGGSGALLNNGAATANTGFGFDTLFSNTTGNYNTAIGFQALRANTTGVNDTANGVRALYANTTGYNNTASGVQALRANTSGYNNTADGLQALQANTTGANNTASGVQALQANTSGYNNTADGLQALQANTTGANNTASGVQALRANTSGGWNTANGYASLLANTTGYSNTAIGSGALYANTTGTGNTAIGLSTFYANTTGSNNIALGAYAGINLQTGSGNIYIGNYGGEENSTTRLGATQTRTFIAGIRGVTTGLANGVPVYIDGNGQLGTASSSRRFKDDIRDIGDASRRLLDLRPVTFHYKQPTANGEKPLEYGLIAEEVAKVYPDLVAYGADGKIETVQYHKLTPMLLNEVQRLSRSLQTEQDKNSALAEQLRVQDSAIQAQTREIADLKQQVTIVQAQARRMEAIASRLESKEPLAPLADIREIGKRR